MTGTIPSLPGIPTVPGFGDDNASAFSPEDIAGLLYWFDTSVAGSLWQDEAGTTPAVADAAILARWDDQSGNNYHLTSPSTSGGGANNVPTLRTNIINGKPIIRMDGTDDFLMKPSGVVIGGSEITVIVVAKRVAFINNNEGLMSLAGTGVTDFGNATGLAVGASDTTDLQDARGSVDLSLGSHPGNGVPFIYITRLDGVEQQCWTNNAASTPVANAGTVGTFNVTRLIIGFRYAGGGGSLSNPNRYDYAEILAYDHALSAPDRIALQSYLADKYAITLS